MKNDSGELMVLFLVFIAVCVIVFLVFLFSSYNSLKLNSGETITVENESFMYVEAEKWMNRQGATAVLEAISRFKKENPELCLLQWHHEMTGELGENIQSYGIWIHHKPKPFGGC